MPRPTLPASIVRPVKCCTSILTCPAACYRFNEVSIVALLLFKGKIDIDTLRTRMREKSLPSAARMRSSLPLLHTHVTIPSAHPHSRRVGQRRGTAWLSMNMQTDQSESHASLAGRSQSATKTTKSTSRNSLWKTSISSTTLLRSRPLRRGHKQISTRCAIVCL